MGSVLSTPYPEASGNDVDGKSYDYIIIGGGTAGCVLASRLSEDEDVSVLLVERGPVDDTWVSRVPLLSSDMGGISVFKHWESEPSTHLSNIATLVMRGEGLGGSSRINGMLYTRGNVAEYDNWAAHSSKEWAYENIEKYFVRAEHSLSQPSSKFRGSSGPWYNQVIPMEQWPFRSFKMILDCAKTWGLPHVSDGNSPDTPANRVQFMDITIDAKRQRISTYRAFLPAETAVSRKGRLTICTNSLVIGMDLEAEAGGQGQTVKRVHFEACNPIKSGKKYTVHVKREAILCSGALGSPQVLMLSGIGPAQHLKDRGINVRLDLPGVGSYLKDHLSFPVDWEVPVQESLNKLRLRPWLAIIAIFRYLITGLGVVGVGFICLAIFVCGNSIVDEDMSLQSDNASNSNKESLPDIELMPIATACADPSQDGLKIGTYTHQDKGAFSIMACVLRPKSHGKVRLDPQNPRTAYPRVDFGFLSDESDYPICRKAVKLSMKFGDLLRAKGFPLKRILSGPTSLENEDVDKFIRKRARTTFHFTSTCRMASRDDPVSPGVVDSNLRVYGTSNLRVSDASTFPDIIACHPQAAVVMVAEKCSDMIKETWK
ncbi:hypothetical protein F5884DRAFT_785476 [Xylogone sp. PMI_703]|nr:hypothetical protein F5884DRAFT_785476 [Xylogone sp. PMI_703]